MEKNFFLVQLVGEYFIKSGTENMLRSFDIELKLPKWQHALSMARNHVLPPLMSEKDPGFNGIRRCIILQVKTKDGHDVAGLPFSMQNRDQLQDFVDSQGIMLDTRMYPDIIKLRKRVEFAKHNPGKFKKQEVGKQRSYATISEALSLNTDVLAKVQKVDIDVQAKATPQESAGGIKVVISDEALSAATQEDSTPPAEPPVQEAGETPEGEDFDPHHGEESASMFDD